MDQRRGDEANGFVDLGIDGFEQATEIGRGGFSIVYRAWQPSFQRLVAIKVLAARLDDSEVNRFDRECRAIGSLQGHPNIVTVHHAGRRDDGQPYIVMEFLRGGSLAQQLAQHPLGWATAVDIGVKLAGALECAHLANVLHRDLKPGNVLISRVGDCKLGDFGIARIEGRGETTSGTVTASWEYAPPEVVNGLRPSPASDVYSLASTIFALIDGRPPFARRKDESVVALSNRIVRSPVRRMGGNAPEVVERVIRRGLAKDLKERPATAAQFGRLLRTAQAQAGVAVTPLPLDVDKADREVTQPAPPSNGRVAPSVPGPTEDANVPARAASPRQPRKGGGRRLWALGGGILVAAAMSAFLLKPDGGHDTASGPTTTGIGPTTTADTTGGTTASSSLTSSATPTTAGAGARLGPDLAPTTTDPCHTPGIANGAAWQLGSIEMGGRTFASSYFCNMFTGGTGSLDFVLGGTYRTLRLSIGFADESKSTSQQVRFEIIADGRDYLIDPPTLAFGAVQDLELDVTGVTQLRIKIIEQSPAGGGGGSSLPVLGTPTLTPV